MCHMRIHKFKKKPKKKEFEIMVTRAGKHVISMKSIDSFCGDYDVPFCTPNGDGEELNKLMESLKSGHSLIIRKKVKSKGGFS